MHAHYLASLVFVIFVALIVADTSATDPRLPRSDHSKRNKSQLANETGISISKLLKRGEDDNTGPAEERLGELSVSVSEKLKSLFTPATATSKTMNRWAKNKKSAEAAFARLRLDRGANPILQPQFSKWVEHVDEMNVPGESVIETLTKIYGDDKVFRMIKKAKLDSGMQNYAITLEADQMKRWVAIRKDPDEIFRLFDLDVVRYHIFEKPEFSTWAKYVEDVSARHPEQPSLMYTTLAKYYYDDALLNLANAAKRSENTMPMANKVIDDWFHAGVQTHKTPYQAFRDLGLGKSTDTYPHTTAVERKIVGKHLGPIYGLL
ncbi:RxLR effector protein [Phytophthora megakarya]|uniref:RxLR effector protein n=1 Tax=Phytophthora megakarya TaxID=4795 RepID=A0A225V625_9STRA|nr:RxLR effector protein [Phytophthora megakarya]